MLEASLHSVVMAPLAAPLGRARRLAPSGARSSGAAGKHESANQPDVYPSVST